ncbi:MAG: menaquinone-specific isochorismate synthase [Thermoleophilaceae bacterium]|nr:menaquinone-specific isochorismate synthase [Thermoleophilaceae bacterium]
MTTRTAGGSPFALGARDRARLAERAAAAARRAARERREVIASVDVAVAADVDPSAVVMASRRPDDRFFCFEQPDRGGFALAGLGSAALVAESGPDRFAAAARACRTLGHGALTDGDGPAWVGGFAFAPAGGSSPEWSSLAPAQLVLPEAALHRSGGAVRLTLTALVAAGDDPQAVGERLAARAASLRADPMPLLDPHPVERARVASAAPPEHFEAAIIRATERMAAGDLQKVVLAREVRVHTPEPIDPAPIYDGLRTVFPSCYCYLVGSPELAFVGASPELLVRRDGARAQTVALAGTRRRSADPAVDRHLGEQLLSSPKDREEQAIVTRRIERTLSPVALWVAAAEEPVLVRVHNVQHLATPIRAQLAEPIPAVELAGLLHPTPAVGGEPEALALPLIPALEGLDRGWYAGPVGWTDLSEDGEFCVALRCALLRDRVAHLYAGEGIVIDSDPAQELEANEAKLQALLPLLT